jgi:DNA repair protein RadD
MKLRNYQIELIQKIHEAWNNGAQNVLMQSSTGSGKTVTFCEIIRDSNVPTVVIAHRVELVSQISLTLARNGIYHNIIGQRATVRDIVATHLHDLGRSYYDTNATVHAAGVDTLIRQANEPWMSTIKLVVCDEAHHVLKTNKWGVSAAMFPNARGLYPTATPVRTDGKGLGRHADGIIDLMVQGPPMRQLIEEGFLCDYRIFAPSSDLDLTGVPITASGEFSPKPLSTAVHKSHITGDVVSHYLRIAPGQLGITFAVDVEAASEIAAEFRAQGVAAEVVSAKTPPLLRAHIMKKFRLRQILQLVNVDILGEGVDVPNVSVISLARPTASFGLYCQQIGRGLRPKDGERCIIIDHVGNTMRHGLVDAPRVWTLDRRDKRSRVSKTTVKTCLECFSVYSVTVRVCPDCGHFNVPKDRSRPEYVDGDLLELDSEVLAMMRGAVDRIDREARISNNHPPHIQIAIRKKHNERIHQQNNLRNQIAIWAGFLKRSQQSDSAMYRAFYHTFGTDILSAQALGSKDAQALAERVHSVWKPWHSGAKDNVMPHGAILNPPDEILNKLVETLVENQHSVNPVPIKLPIRKTLV